MRQDTIVAPATPPGVSGLAVIRLSGPDTIPVLNRLLPGHRWEKQPAWSVRLVWLKEKEDRPLDQVTVALFRAPRSYTGEDMAEISCHGSPFIVDRIVRLCLKHGCRLALPGEFTRRAVLNRKLTLSQAEAVLSLVNARSELAHQQALAGYQGATTKFVRKLSAALTDLYTEIEYLLSFDEEERTDRHRLKEKTASVLRLLREAIKQGEHQRFLFQGARVAIVGRPNVGKSSLFNRLLAEERAITSPIPGTTRDRIEATTTIGPVTVQLIDTCGFDPGTRDPLTRLGTRQTEKALTDADLLLVVFDGSQPARQQDRTILAWTEKMPKIYIINKSDLKRRLPDNFLPRPAIAVSCKTGANINRVRQALLRHLRPFSPKDACPFTSRRQLQALKECYSALLSSSTSPDLATCAADIRLALDALAQIDAPVTNEDILNRIFNSFCVGK